MTFFEAMTVAHETTAAMARQGTDLTVKANVFPKADGTWDYLLPC